MGGPVEAGWHSLGGTMPRRADRRQDLTV